MNVQDAKQLAFKFTRKEEGGWVDNPNDPGKETMAGISREYHPKLKLWILIDEMKRAVNSPEAFKKAIQTTAIEAEITSFYSKHWNKFKCSELDSRIGIALFDTSFMTGKAVSLLQKSIIYYKMYETAPLSNEPMIKADNDIGQFTIDAANSTSQDELLNIFILSRIEYQTNLSDSKYFYKDWTNRSIRLYRFLYKCFGG